MAKAFLIALFGVVFIPLGLPWLAISHVSALVSILCGVYQGIDQRTSLMILEQDIRVFQRERIRREMEKRPGPIKVASFILMFMVPIVLMIIKNLQSVGF
ncbi:MAG: hypothetical protein EOM08_04020 [Clostridia bacterium]|nr:hypothetical protein [Clostridia bacterium]NCC75585.1 hypothetical protein [Clostridia bacterium]